MAATPIWPVTHDIPDTIKNFICRFYKLADAKEGDGPEQFAALFTEDGIARGLTNTARGTRGNDIVCSFDRAKTPSRHITMFLLGNHRTKLM